MSKATRSWSGKKILFALMLSASAAWLLSLSNKDLSVFSVTDLSISHIEGDNFPKVLIDPLGQRQSLVRAATRISSTVLAADEMLLYLNETKRARAVTYLADDRMISIAAGHYSNAIGRIKLNTELILRDQPDLIIVAPFIADETVRLLSGTGATVMRMGDFNSFADIEHNILLLAEAIGERRKALQLIDDSRRLLNDIELAVAGSTVPRVLYYSMSGSTAGKNSVTNEMIQRAGGFNVINETDLSQYPRISQEQAIALQPDIILMSAWDKDSSEAAVALFSEPAWQSVPAVKNRRVYITDSAYSTSISPARFDGTLQLAKLLHPQRATALARIQPITERYIGDIAPLEYTINAPQSAAVVTKP